MERDSSGNRTTLRNGDEYTENCIEIKSTNKARSHIHTQARACKCKWTYRNQKSTRIEERIMCRCFNANVNFHSFTCRVLSMLYSLDIVLFIFTSVTNGFLKLWTSIKGCHIQTCVPPLARVHSY